MNRAPARTSARVAFVLSLCARLPARLPVLLRIPPRALTHESGGPSNSTEELSAVLKGDTTARGGRRDMLSSLTSLHRN